MHQLELEGNGRSFLPRLAGHGGRRSRDSDRPIHRFAYVPHNAHLKRQPPGAAKENLGPKMIMLRGITYIGR